MNQIDKDWKLYRKNIAKWQESHMEKLLKGYADIIDSNVSASERFWKIEDRINKDKKTPGVKVRLSKSEFIWDMAIMLHDGAISSDDLEGFSDETIEKIYRFDKSFN